MPLADIDHIKKVYQQIIQRALQTEGEGCTTYIFVSNDTDALCALKILTVSSLKICILFFTRYVKHKHPISCK